MAGFIKPIDQVTLQNMSSGGMLGGLARGTLQGLQLKREQEQADQQKQLRQMQMQKMDYDMKAQVGMDVLRDKALGMDVPGTDADADAWMKYGRAQEVGGFTNSAKQAYDFAELVGSTSDIPENFKNFPELMKLQVARRQALKDNDLTTAKEVQDRINKIKDKKVPADKGPRIESSKQSAANIASLLTTSAGITIEGAEAQALGDLSRSLTDQAHGKFKLTQSEMNDQIAVAYQQIIEERKETLGNWDYVPFVNAEKPTKQEVEQRVIKNILDANAKEAGRGTETAVPSEEDQEEDLVSMYAPKPAE